MEKASRILNEFAVPEMVKRRDFKAGKLSACVLFNPDITDQEVIREVIFAAEQSKVTPHTADEFIKQTMFAAELSTETDLSQVIKMILSGDTALVFDGMAEVVIIATRKWDKRSIQEPPTETVVLGPREGFVEDFKTNLSMVERRLKTPDFAIEKMVIGRKTASNVAICYLKNVAKKEIVDKVKKRLKKIDIDGVMAVHNLEEFLDERPYSIFRQCGVTEKPDIVAARILEGRVAVILEGTPMVLTVPYLMLEEFQSNEDYYQRHTYSSFIRFLRYFSLIIALFLPGLYVSVQVYNYDIIPLRLLITIMNAIKGTPLSPLSEMLFVILLFEVIRESTVRMPRAVGAAMSIVGALVLGETAVNAGIISSPSVLITAMSSIALFLVPNIIGTSTLLRVILTIVGGMLGIYGLILSAIFIIHYLAGLDSFNTPYLAPFAPLVTKDLKDSITKRPLIDLKKRPESIPNTNPTRQK